MKFKNIDILKLEKKSLKSIINTMSGIFRKHGKHMGPEKELIGNQKTISMFDIKMFL